MPSNILSKSIFCTFFIFILSGCGDISAEISSLHNYQNAHNNDLPIGDSAITPPHMLVLKSPIYSTSIVSNIIITVDGVEPGDKVYLYDDAACFLSRGSAVASAKTIDILHDPIINIGIYTIYARRTNNSGKSSGCSSSFVVYEKTNDLLGSLDLKFNTSGFVTKSGVYPGADITGSNIIFTENGDLLLPGMIRQHANCSFNCYDGIIQKINLEGKYDLNFGTNGVMTYHRTSYDYINYLHFQKETSLIISAGSSDVSGDNPTLTAFNLSGILATSFGSTSGSFGTNGYFLISNGTAKTAVLDPDNNNHLYIGGSSQGVTLDAIIWKINLVTASLSGDFGVGGKFTHHNAAGGNGDDEIQALAFHPTIRRLIALGRSQVGPSNFDIVTWLIK